MILISDGYDEHSHASFEEALAAVKSAGITIYVVGIGGVAGISLKGERELKRLASETGGRVFFPPRPEELAGVYDQLAADAQNRYLVTYTPTNTARDGSWRAVNLATPAAAVPRADAAGYRAPKPPPIRPTLEFTVTDLTGQYVEISADDLVVSEDGDRSEGRHVPRGRRHRCRSCSRSIRAAACGRAADALDGRGADVRRGAPPGGQAVAALLLGRRGRRARPRHQPSDQHRCHQRLQAGRRHGPLRRPGRSVRRRSSRSKAGARSSS